MFRVKGLVGLRIQGPGFRAQVLELVFKIVGTLVRPEGLESKLFSSGFMPGRLCFMGKGVRGFA
jgi:hypothetical protein